MQVSVSAVCLRGPFVARVWPVRGICPHALAARYPEPTSRMARLALNTYITYSGRAGYDISSTDNPAVRANGGTDIYTL